MKDFKIELLFALIGSLISLVFILNPSPFWMALFVFGAQPMYIFAIASVLIKIYRDLKSKEVI